MIIRENIPKELPPDVIRSEFESASHHETIASAMTLINERNTSGAGQSRRPPLIASPRRT